MSNDANSTNYDVIVIGGGASGMLAAAVAAEQGATVLLLEKNSVLGKKLSITGGGRCNITNAETDVRTLLANYGNADKFLFSAFSRFGMQDTIQYFEGLGLPIKIEAKKRAFPKSEKATDVVRVLEKALQKHAVTTRTNAEVQKINAKNGEITGILVNNEEIQAKNYILATGGASKPETGSTGDGFKWLEELGHTLREPTPNVTPIAVNEKWVKESSGITAPAVDVIFFSGDKRCFKIHGDILLTHFGISGPTVLNNAYKVAELLEQGKVTAQMDCFPDKNEKELDLVAQETLQNHPAKQLKNTLKHIAPTGMAKIFIALTPGKDLDTNNSELSKKSRVELVRLLKNLPLTIDKLMGFEKAVVADGGLALEDIDTRTMLSKKISNLYITGDLLDINRPSGGYSLQLCWTTGYIAGSNSSM